MKTNMQILSALILLIIIPESQILAQSAIDEYDGIPLVIYPSRSTQDMVTLYPNSFSQMETMGVFGVVATVPLPNNLQPFTDHNLKVIPNQMWISGDPFYYNIFKYTDAHYTVWEAEGTTYIDTTNGKATLYPKSSTTILNVDGRTVVKAEGGSTPAGDTIITGPGYPQNATYKWSSNLIQYTLESKMKIVQTGTLPPNYLDDVICKIIVTNRKDGDNQPETVVDDILEVKVRDFLPPLGYGWDNWDSNISLTYNLEDEATDLQGSKGTLAVSQLAAYFVKFKVLWMELDYLDLYINKMKVYDDKGFNIIETQIQKLLIDSLVNKYITSSTVIGWYGVDEPGGIDNYEPYRVVDSIINSVSGGDLSLHAAFTGAWLGKIAYGDKNYGMAHNLYSDEEFWLRAKPENVQLNLYMYHNPWRPWWQPPLPVNPNWKTDNIDYVIGYLDRVNGFDTSFAVSTQAGAYYDYDKNNPCTLVDSFIIPLPSQINYHVNLCLMYGMRELRLDPFFSLQRQNCPTDTYDTAGLIDKTETETANYNFFKNMLIPRLNGWFGKTLRRLNQYKQFPYINALVYPDNSTPYEFIDFVKVTGGPNDTCWIDLGFFKDPQDLSAKYFMTVNRYYSNKHSMRFGLKDLTYYKNWNITDYIDTTSFTLIQTNGRAEFVDNIIAEVAQQNNFPIRLHAAITGSWQGKFAFSGSNYGMAHDIFVADEFWLRAKPKNMQMNLYNYQRSLLTSTE